MEIRCSGGGGTILVLVSDGGFSSDSGFSGLSLDSFLFVISLLR